MVVGGTRRRREPNARRRKTARHRAVAYRQHDLQLAAAGDLRCLHFPGDLDLELSASQRGPLRQHREQERLNS